MPISRINRPDLVKKIKVLKVEQDKTNWGEPSNHFIIRLKLPTGFKCTGDGISGDSNIAFMRDAKRKC